jgi:hypothetical protein
MLVRATHYSFAHGTSGAARIRHSLRPLISFGREAAANSGRSAPRECEGVFGFRHCERSEAIHTFYAAKWIASLRSQ